MATHSHSDNTFYPVDSQWKGKKVAFLGDSITDIGDPRMPKLKYCGYLKDFLGIEPLVYAVSGQTWFHIVEQAQKLKAEYSHDVDAIFILAGANDYMEGVPLGEWWTVKDEEANCNGVIMTKPRRHLQMDGHTFKGRINAAMNFLRTNFPEQQIILLTPIHRGFSQFSDTNVQPDESFPNKLGLYSDVYASVTREAGGVWSVPVIDLNSICGLYPLNDAFAGYFKNGETDRLHPNETGHFRIAKALMYQLLIYPSDFKDT